MWFYYWESKSDVRRVAVITPTSQDQPFRLGREGQRFRCVAGVGYPLSMLATAGAARGEYLFSSLLKLVNAGRSGHIATSFGEVHAFYASACPTA